MNDTPFAPFPTTEQFPAQWNGPAATATDAPKRRGPRRTGSMPELAAPYSGATSEALGGDLYASVAAKVLKPKGRPKKVVEAPVQQAPALSSLFQILAGLQTADVVPLTSCYELLAALPPPDRSRVLGMLNRVLG